MFDERGRVWITSAVRPPDNPTFCKAGSDHPSAKLFPLTARRPAPRGVRSQDAEAHAHQHLLRHPSPDVRRGREQHAVDQRRRTGGRLAQHEACSTRPATRRSRRAGRRSSSTPTATASAMRTSSPTSRSIPTKDKRIDAGLLLGGAGAGRLGLGLIAGLPRRRGPPGARRRIRRRRRCRSRTSCR